MILLIQEDSMRTPPLLTRIRQKRDRLEHSLAHSIDRAIVAKDKALVLFERHRVGLTVAGTFFGGVAGIGAWVTRSRHDKEVLGKLEKLEALQQRGGVAVSPVGEDAETPDKKNFLMRWKVLGAPVGVLGAAVATGMVMGMVMGWRLRGLLPKRLISGGTVSNAPAEKASAV